MRLWLRFFWFTLKAGAAVALIVWLAGLGGAATLDLGGWRVETRAGMLAVAGLLVALAAILIDRLWRGLSGAPSGFRRRREADRLRRGYETLTEGFAALAAGEPATARSIATRLGGRRETRPLARFLEALAARADGDEAKAAQHFGRLMEEDRGAFLGLRGLLAQAAQSGDRAAAATLIDAAHRLRPGSPWAARARFGLAVSERRWEEAQSTLALAARAGAYGAGEAARLEAALALEQARAAEDAGRTEAAYAFARQAYKARPDWAPAVAAWADALLAAGKRRQAVKVLEAAWAAAPHPALVQSFLGAAPETSALGRAAWAARLTVLSPGSADAALAQAEAALAAGLWGEARRLLHAVLAEGPSRRASRLMADLARARPGETEGTPEAWLERAADAPPGPTWTCSACGTRHAAWRGLCEGCGSFATLEWRQGAQAPAASVLAAEPAFPLLESAPGRLSRTGDGRNT